MRSCREQPADREYDCHIRSLLVLGLCSVVFLGVCCSGCRRKAPPEPQVKEPNTAQAPAEAPQITPSAEKLVVTVNGTKIIETQLEKRVDELFRQYGADKAAKLPPAFAVQLRKQIRPRALETLIIEQLIGEKIREAKIEVTDDDITEHIKEVASSQDPPLSVDDFKARAAAQGVNFDDPELRQQIRQGLGFQKLLQVQYGNLPPVAEAEARKYYDENQADFDVPEQVRASHILISTDTADPNADPNVVAAQAKAKAEDLLKQIKDGADFAELAIDNSSCPSASKGGDLGLFARGTMVEPFEKVAFTMKPGEISDVVETRFGYHIIKVIDHKDPSRTSFEEAKGGIIENLTQQKKAAASQGYIESLKSKASIVYAPGWEPKPQSSAPSSDAATTR